MSQAIYTLLCHRDIEMALITLPKIVNFLEPNQPFIVVDDGSMTLTDIDKIHQLSSSIQVISRKQRDEFVLEALDKYPNCRKFRDEYGPSFKLIDIPLMAQRQSGRFTYTDTDIIYLKKCESYFSQEVNTYLMTDAIKLSFKLIDAFYKYNWIVPYRFNSGYFSFDAKDHDLDFIEYFVSRPDVRNIPWVIEQTGWALLFGRAGASYCPSENQFICREQFNGPTSDTLAIHLIANLKGKVQDWSIPQTFQLDTSSNPTFERSRNVTQLDWLKKSARRFLPSL